MRLLLTCLVLALAGPLAHGADDARAELERLLKSFRTDGPRGWAFTQTTESGDQKRVERYDPAQPEFARWTLLEQNGRAPTADELRDYREKTTRFSRAGNAPHLTNQFDLATLTLVEESAERSTWRCGLKPTEAGDATARYLAATLVLHKPTSTIESLEIAATEPFSPTLGVKIHEMKTTLHYSLPAGERPSLLVRTATRLRGRAFFFRSLDADMTVTFTNHEKARPRP